LIPRLAAQLFELIKAGSALSDVYKQMSELSVCGLLRKFLKNFVLWAVNALRIRKVFVHDAIKCVEQLFFQVHSSRPTKPQSPSPTAMLPQQNPTIDSRCR
jgi:hypothetical protein